jgi:hypothetical protein
MNTLSLESETPSGLWNTQWNATATPSEYEDIVIESLSGAVYELANAPSDHQSQSSPKELVVKGSDIRQAGDDLICQLEVAVESKDFTDILSSDRTFKT